MPSLRHPRGTRAALVSLASANGLKSGQLYLLTDESRIAIATAAGAFETFAKESEAGGANNILSLSGVVSEPATPPADTLLLYAKKIAGRMIGKAKGPSGVDYPLQAAFWQNNITMWSATAATAGVWMGTIGAGTGTYSAGLPTATSIYTSIKRSRWANVITTLNQVLGQRSSEALFMRGAAAGQGGYFFYARGGFDIWTNGARFFTGMHSGTGVISANPSALNNTAGFCIDDTDNGAISFLTRGTAATKAATGFSAVTGKGFDFYMFCAPNSAEIAWRIVDLNTGAEASGVATLNLPTNGTALTAGFLASNAALTPVNAVQIGLNRIYVETDY